MHELANMVKAGHRAAVLYIIQRSDCNSFAVASDLDPGYAEAFEAARNVGVEAYAYACDISLQENKVAGGVEIVENELAI